MSVTPLALGPDDWFTEKTSSSILITAYRMLLVERDQLPHGEPICMDFDLARILLIWGKTEYFDYSQSKPEYQNNGDAHIHQTAAIRKTQEGAWLLVTQPLVINGKDRGETFVKQKAGSYAAAFMAVHGRNVAFERVYDMVRGHGTLSAASPTFINPKSFPAPDLSADRLNTTKNVILSIEKLDAHKRRRYELALHWYERAQRSIGIDEFIFLWVALETLGMPDTTNIKPINQTLAEAYEIDYRTICEIFALGRIQDLRSRILHNGESFAVNALLADYMAAVFADLLLATLGLTIERRAMQLLERPGFDIKALTAGPR